MARGTVCLFLAALLLSANALAQAPEGAPTGSAPIRPQLLPAPRERIEVQGNALRERRESTASKIVVPHDEVVKYGDTNLLDVLKRQPGITVGRGNDVQMRGLGSGYTQVLVNGERVPPGFSLDSVQPDLIERIEIIRGATAEYSTQGVAGTINIVLRRTVDQARRELKMGAATQNGATSANAFGQVADRVGNLSFTLPFAINRFGFEYENLSESRTLTPAGDTLQHFTAQNGGQGHGTNGNLSPRLLWNFEPGHSLAWETFLFTGRFWTRFGEESVVLAPPPPPVTSSGSESHSSFTSGRSNLTWNRGLGEWGRLELKVGGNLTRRDVDNTFLGRDLAGALVQRRYTNAGLDDDGLVFTGKHVMSILEDHSFVTGWDGGWNRRDETRLLDQSNPSAGTGTITQEAYESRVSRLALFAQDEWDVAPQLSAYAGLRWEGIVTRSSGNTFEASENRASVASPILQGLWRLPGTKKDQVRAGLARTFRAPSAIELIPRRYFAANNTPTTPDYAGNANLKPELSWGLDVAYEHYPEGGGVASLSAFVRRIEDAFVREVVFEDGAWVSRPANGGQAVARGIEMDFKVNLRQLVKDAPSVDLRANAGINQSHVDSVPGPDNRLAQQTPWSFNVGLDYRASKLPLTVGGNFNATAGGPVRVSESQQVWSSVTRNLEVYALWRFSPGTQVRLTASQLFTPDNVSNETFDTGGVIQQRGSVNRRFPRLAVLFELKL